ncbi:MAG: hypothetical protein ABFC77_14775 [Thermoguttaceae bacterium]
MLKPCHKNESPKQGQDSPSVSEAEDLGKGTGGKKKLSRPSSQPSRTPRIAFDPAAATAKTFLTEKTTWLDVAHMTPGVECGQNFLFDRFAQTALLAKRWFFAKSA